MSALDRYTARWVQVPNGRTIRGRAPGRSAVVLTEHRLRDELARMLTGYGLGEAITEAHLPYGFADVLTATVAFEVEPAPAWRHGTRQALQYAAQTGCAPAVALFGAASPADVTKIYRKLRDGVPTVQLWWYGTAGRWERITSSRLCRAQVAVGDDHVPAG